MKAYTYISGDAVSGALILTLSFNRLQNSSSICTPGYGDAPEGVQKGTLIKCQVKLAYVWITMMKFYAAPN